MWPCVLGGCSDPEGALAATNALRAQHGVPPLTWDNGLALESAAWAFKLAQRGCAKDHDYSVVVGENIFTVTELPPPDKTCTPAVHGWYSEISEYNFTTSAPFTVNHDDGVGHFTQLVWRATTTMGCGTAVVSMMLELFTGYRAKGGCKVVVCRYLPPGNIASDKFYRANGYVHMQACMQVLPLAQPPPPRQP
ncbi:hypothetical protein VOLCADRAFT_92972 [Volvox carteri f. nagariensis]|uniref:SCP domain-containing protein n=1 Tax=Volvox carteri f. nagariensis TaxID=3068 RepID=D8U101_VOLCA|nr:uncharacterized protein VOLCADRAFT_92972 [Volvox carteri f. nagariensis]EFJ46548.1 hypothetical protein VOLCADRAFT_92972 [Volvox carteri f. nagariensis]|eukprot:XP_002952405.1 hypothetical protein VOLCADRAFT_92972 [Volvox carteri f. nagariensis]